MTIYATRGDVVYFPVEKKVGDAKYLFQAGDIVRIKICEKKNYSKVFLLKDFVVEESTTSVNIFLSKWEMKFGPIIHKATDYWYEVELNPDTYPDTFIGHNENGPAIFKLFPEAKDVVEGEIPDPEENAAVSRMVVHFVNEYLGDKAETIIQEILKEEYLETVINEILKEENIESIIQEILKEDHLETIVQEIIKEESIDTIIQEIVKPGNVETIIQEIIKEENIETIIQEILKTENVGTIVQEITKPENISTIVQEVLKPGNVETIVQEIIREENLGTIVQEIIKSEHIQDIVQEVLKPENTQTIVQEILKPENTQVIVEQVLEEIPKHMEVEIDSKNMTANRSSAEIIQHLNSGGSVIAKLSHGAYATLQGVANDTVLFRELSYENAQTELITFAIWADGSVTRDAVAVCSGGEVTGIDFSNFENGSYTETIDGEVITHEVTFDEQGRPTAIDGCAIVWGAS
jgi:hypothetical protein